MRFTNILFVLAIPLTVFACSGDGGGGTGATDGGTDSGTDGTGGATGGTTGATTTTDSAGTDSASGTGATSGGTTAATTGASGATTTDGTTTDATTGGTTGGVDELGCGQVVDCMENCDGDESCETACTDAASADATAELDALNQCIEENNCMNDQCIDNNCEPELIACFTGELTCGGILDCLDACGDETCEDACWYDGSLDGQEALDDFFTCIEDNACEDEACIAENCSDRAAACL